MKNLLILLFFIILPFSNVYSQNFEDLLKDTQPVEDDPDDFIKFCRTMDRIAPFVSQYKVIPWVVVGAPGLVLAQFEDSAAIFEICDYYISIKKNDDRANIYNSINFLNKMTNDRFNDQFDLLFSYHNFAASIYDMEKGEFRKGAMTNASNHNRLIRLIDKTKRYYNKQKDPYGGTPQGLENASTRQQKINEISELAYTQAILNESLSCPKPRLEANQREFYNKEITPKEVKLRDIDREIDFYSRQLVRMGGDMYLSLSEKYKQYINDINFLQSGYIAFSEEERSETRTTNVYTDKKDENGKPIWKDRTFQEKYNHFTIRKNFKYLSEIRRKYVKDWDSYILNQKVGNSRGLLNDAQGKIEKKYRSFSFECSEIRLRQTNVELGALDDRDPSYKTLLNTAQKKCQENLRYREDDFKNLMENYITNIALKIETKNQLLIDIWNFEGKYLGYNRTVVGQSTLENFQKPEIKCSETLEVSQMRSVGLKFNSVKTKIKSEILESKVKSNIVRESELKARSDDKTETATSIQRRNRNVEERTKTNTYTSPITRVKGGI